PQEEQVEERYVEQIAVQVLQDQRERGFPPVTGAAELGHGARRWIEEIRAVVSLAIVVASSAEEDRGQKNQEGGGEGEPIHLDERRVERRQVAAYLVVVPLIRRPVRVADQHRKQESLH